MITARMNPGTQMLTLTGPAGPLSFIYPKNKSAIEEKK